MTDKTTSLVEALAAAQAEMQNAVFDSKSNFSKNGKNNYASLTSVRNAVIPVLTKHGIAVTQEVVLHEADPYMRTSLRKGDDVIDGVVPMIFGKKDMHGVGSAMTYARRYGLGAICGIASDEDDDGDMAVASGPAQPVMITPQQVKHIEAELDRTMSNKTKFMAQFEIRSLSEMPSSQYDKALELIAKKERRSLAEDARQAEHDDRQEAEQFTPQS